ncbi:MAG TPA: TonB family protein [Pyrinomonadaceae bacterium]|nr:TonB family protein [Pyrinomonadaceae bacterium]
MRAALAFKASLLAAATLAAAVFAPAPSAVKAQSGRRGEQPTLRLQSDEVARGRKLLEEGDAEGAIKVLREAADRDREDDVARHFLGVALARAGRRDEALKAFQSALELRSRAFNLEFNEQRQADKEWSPGDSSRFRSRFAAKTGALVETVEAFVALGPEDVESLREWLATLRLYAQTAADPKFETQPFRLSQLMTKAQIIRKPEPRYTERARRGRISGLVRLRALLGADGTVKGISIIKGLGGGLSESAAAAALGIKFTPATVDGRPVSQYVVLEYNFYVY